MKEILLYSDHEFLYVENFLCSLKMSDIAKSYKETIPLAERSSTLRLSSCGLVSSMKASVSSKYVTHFSHLSVGS